MLLFRDLKSNLPLEELLSVGQHVLFVQCSYLQAVLSNQLTQRESLHCEMLEHLEEAQCQRCQMSITA